MFALFRFTVVVGEPIVSGLVPNVTVVPAGTPVALSVIGLLKEPLNVAVKEAVIVEGAGQVATTGAGVLKVKPPGAGTLVVQMPRP